MSCDGSKSMFRMSLPTMSDTVPRTYALPRSSCQVTFVMFAYRLSSYLPPTQTRIRRADHSSCQSAVRVCSGRAPSARLCVCHQVFHPLAAPLAARPERLQALALLLQARAVAPAHQSQPGQRHAARERWGRSAGPRASVLHVKLRQLLLGGPRCGSQELSPLRVRARRLWRRRGCLRCCHIQAEACPAEPHIALLGQGGWVGSGRRRSQPRAPGAPRIALSTCCSRSRAILVASSHTCSTARTLLLSSDLWYLVRSSSNTPTWSLKV